MKQRYNLDILLKLLFICLIILTVSTIVINLSEKKNSEIKLLNETILQKSLEIQSLKNLSENQVSTFNGKLLELTLENDKLNNDLDNLDDIKDDLHDLKHDYNDLEDSIIELEDPEVLGNITGPELRSLFAEKTGANIYISDLNYSLTSVNEASIFNDETRVSYNKYRSEEFDCDEFANALYGFWNLDENQFAFGLAWSITHAFNVFVDENRQIWIVEPQTNNFIKIEDITIEKYNITIFVLI